MVSKFRFVGRILSLYFCVLIPLIICSLLVTQASFRQAEEREKQIMLRILQDIAGEFDNWYMDFQEQANVLGERKELSLSMVQSNRIKEMDAIQLLHLIKQFSSHTTEIVVYYGEGKLYSSKGLTSIPVYFDTTLKCEPASIEDGLSTLSAQTSSIVLLQTDNTQDILMYHYPIQIFSSGYPFSAQFFVSIEEIAKVLESYAASNSILFRLTAGDTNAFFQVTDGKCTVLEQDAFLSLQKNQNHVLKQTLAPTDMELELCFDPRISWAELRHFQYVNIGLLALGIFLSVLISFLLSQHRWGRFQSLASSMNAENTYHSPGNTFVDEYGYILTILEQSRRENEQVEQNAQIYRHGLLRQTAMMVFHGMLTNPESIRQMLYSCDLELSEEYYYLCGLVLEDKNLDIRVLEDFFTDCLYCETPVNDKRVLLLLTESATTDQECSIRLDMANRLHRALSAAEISVNRIVLSQIYDKLSMANYAYLEIISLLENPLQPNESIECWDNSLRSSSERLTRSQSEYLELFIEALECQNFQQTKEILDNIFSQKITTESTDSRENQHYLRYCIRQALILAVRGTESEQNSALMAQIVQINPASENRFQDRVLKILHAYCTDDRHSQQLETAVEYVRRNYNHYDMSLEEVAAFVGTSKAQMSRLFKSQLGIGYLDFLTRLRMHKAQELLANTDQSVKSILLEVGYIDKTSFTKKFKAIFGMTPTEYRCQSQGILSEEADQETGG